MILFLRIYVIACIISLIFLIVADEGDTKPYRGRKRRKKQMDSGKNRNEIFRAGDIVQHFKREWKHDDPNQYLYQIIGAAEHTETGEKMMVYQALYGDFRLYVRPYDMFMSRVDRGKYPEIRQEYRFERIKD